MENTHDFVENLNDRQKKDGKNKKRQEEGNSPQKLPNKQHSTNK